MTEHGWWQKPWKHLAILHIMCQMVKSLFVTCKSTTTSIISNKEVHQVSSWLIQQFAHVSDLMAPLISLKRALSHFLQTTHVISSVIKVLMVAIGWDQLTQEGSFPKAVVLHQCFHLQFLTNWKWAIKLSFVLEEWVQLLKKKSLLQRMIVGRRGHNTI